MSEITTPLPPRRPEHRLDAKFVQITTSLAVAGGNVLSGIHALDEDGNVWSFQAKGNRWTAIPRNRMYVEDDPRDAE